MIFGLVRLLIWLAGFLVVAYAGFYFLGYRLNQDYYDLHTDLCQNALQTCEKSFIQNGMQGLKAECRLACFDPRKLLEKKP